MNDQPYTRIGCEVFIRKGDMLLLGKRHPNIYGGGTWALPGGHLIYNERLVDAICREIKEELGAIVQPEQLRLASVVDGIITDKNHYVHCTFELREPDFEPQLMEPDSCEEWRYFPLDALPENILAPHKLILKNYLAQRIYQV